MMLSDKGRDLVSSLPLERLLTETDGPFTEANGHPASPADAVYAVEAMAKLIQATPTELTAKIRQNLKTLLGMP